MSPAPGARKLRVILAAEEGAGAQAMKALAASGHDIVAVLADAPDQAGAASLAGAAQRQGFQVWPGSIVRHASGATAIRGAEADLLLNVHSRHIVCDEVLQAPLIGAFNMHPGPLPRYAGLNGVSWAIYNREQMYGVTIHWMTRRIDAGDIAYQSVFPIEDDDTPLSLMRKCVANGILLFGELLRAASLDCRAIPRVRQNLGDRTYFGEQVPEEGRLSWNRPARDIAGFVRACEYWPYDSPWGYPKTRWRGREFGVMKAAQTGVPCAAEPGTVERCDDSGALVAAADEWIRVRRIMVDGHVARPHEILQPGSCFEK